MRSALHDSTGLLLAHGYSISPSDMSQFVRSVPDDFSMKPLKWRWNGTAYDAVTLTQDQLASGCIDGMDRLQLDAIFNHENRIRTLEGKTAITVAQFRDALIARWKVLNP